MEFIKGTNPESIQIHLKDPPHAYSPGDTIFGTIVFKPKEPVSINELRIQLQGGLNCVIYRKLIAYAFWMGGGWLFRKYIILIDGPTTLPAGEYHYPFAVQVPFTSEPTKLSSMRKWAFKFPPKDPFPGTEGDPHPLPPSMYTESKHLLGYQNGRVQYAINVSTKKGADAKFFSTKALNSRELPIVTPRASMNVDASQLMYTQTHETPHGPVNLHLFVPRQVSQGAILPLCMSAEGVAPGAVRLVRLNVVLTAKNKIRGKHLIAGRFTATSKNTWIITAWKGQNIPLGPGQTHVTPRGDVPGIVPVRFSTWTVACVGHVLDVEYEVMVPGGAQEKKVKGKFAAVLIEVVGWKMPGGGQVVDSKGWFQGVVLDQAEYEAHQTRMGRK